MQLRYKDIFSGGEVKKITAGITTDHPASSYGLPVIVFSSGDVLDYQSWILLGYTVNKATRTEQAMLDKWMHNMPLV